MIIDFSLIKYKTSKTHMAEYLCICFLADCIPSPHDDYYTLDSSSVERTVLLIAGRNIRSLTKCLNANFFPANSRNRKPVKLVHPDPTLTWCDVSMDYVPSDGLQGTTH